MDLPSELKEQIISSIPPAERRHLRLVNKSMLNAVAKSMRDVLEIAVSLNDDGCCHLLMTTVNPYNGTTATYDYKSDPWWLSFPLHWAGICTESLSVTTANCFAKEGSRLLILRRVFEMLNSEDACPNLKQLSITSCRLISDEVFVLNHVLEYVTKRQQQVKAAADRSPPFLRSLSLIAPSNCCGSYKLREYADLVRDSILFERKMALFHTAHKPPIQPPAQPNLLQEILNQCDGLKVLNVDSLLMAKSLPVVALHYPMTLTHLKTTRLGETVGELSTVVNNCPHLQIVKDLSGDFTCDDANIRALVSLSDLRTLSIVSAATGDEMVLLDKLIKEAFGEPPHGPRIVHPWPQITSIALNYVTNDYLKLLSRACPTLQEVRILMLAYTPAVTEEAIGYFIDLPDLRVLIVEDKNKERPVLVGDSLLDAIANKCHRLEQLSLFPCSVPLLSLPRLLRECPRLRSVTLRSLSVALKSLDGLVMVRSLEHDLCDRKVATIVEVKEIRATDYASVKRIIDGLEAGTVMVMPSLTFSCVHDLKVCASCRFDAPEARAILGRWKQDWWDACSCLFVLAQRRRPNAAIVFVASEQ